MAAADLRQQKDRESAVPHALRARVLVAPSPGRQPVVVLGLMSVVTALLTNAISNDASVVLMIPVAVQAAPRAAPTSSPLSWR